MEKDIILYHGSQQLVEKPLYGIGKTYNDYGQGFYCTENMELAKEWACPVKNNGYANCYKLHVEGLTVMNLTKGEYNILSWLSILLSNRFFILSSSLGESARDFLISRFKPDTSDVDVMIGYRADDSYFSFAADFVNNVISLGELNRAMQLGMLGEQVVLLSERSFTHIEYLGHETALCEGYYFKRSARNTQARIAYAQDKKHQSMLTDDIFILDILREDMKHDDPRLQSIIS